MTLKIRILRCSRRLFKILVSLTWHYLVKKCLYLLDAYVVSCPTQSKNLESILSSGLDSLPFKYKVSGNKVWSIFFRLLYIPHVCLLDIVVQGERGINLSSQQEYWWPRELCKHALLSVYKNQVLNSSLFFAMAINYNIILL